MDPFHLPLVQPTPAQLNVQVASIGTMDPPGLTAPPFSEGKFALLLQQVKQKQQEYDDRPPVDMETQLIAPEVGHLSLEEFLFLQENYPNTKGLWRKETGEILYLGLPSRVHANGADFFQHTITYQLILLGLFTSSYCPWCGDTRCIIGASVKEPDKCFCPQGRRSDVVADPQDNLFPTFVVEVAVTHESLPILREEVRLWMSAATDVQMCVGIKVWERTQRMVAICGTRNLDGTSSFEEVPFWPEPVPGNAECSNFPKALVIPIKGVLFHNAPLPVNIPEGATVTVNLSELARSILNFL